MLSDRPLGKAPALIEYVIVSLSASVAPQTKEVETVLKALPMFQAAVVNTGAESSAVIALAKVAARPEPFASLNV